MTVYKHVTSAIESFDGATFNSDQIKMYVNEYTSNWSAANNLVQSELRSEDPRFFYKTASRKFLWETHFRHTQKVSTLPFWENVLKEMSNVDRLEIHKQTKGVIRKTLMEVISLYVNKGCILLPMVPSKSPNTPDWHSTAKPKVTGYPYDDLLEAYRINCANSIARNRGVENRFRYLFSSVRISEINAFTIEFDEALSKAIRKNMSERDFAEYVKLMAVVSDHCCRAQGVTPFITYFHRNGVVALRSSPVVVSGVFSKSTDDVRQYDVAQTMRNYIGEQLTGYDILHRDEWIEEICAWASTSGNKSIAPLYSDICRLFEWMSANGLRERKPMDLNRTDFVATRDREKNTRAYFEVLGAADLAGHAKSRIVRNLVDFYGHCHDYNLERTGRSVPSPLTESDKKRFVDTKANLRGKSNKPVLPRRIIEMAKNILLENDYAFAKRFLDHYVTIWDGENEEKLFVPTISNLLFLILSIPIRTAQAMMLDSGEADEYVVALTGDFTKNIHPLAKKGRRLGYARCFASANGMAQFSGIFINTNKENVLEQRGYEIPYHDSRLMAVLESQRLFQEAFNPINVMVNRSQIGPKDLRYQGNNADQLETYTFLFRDIRKGAKRWDLVNRSRVSDFWIQLLLEIQERLAAEESPVQLVCEDDKGNLRTDFTLHSLRVSNITHFIEAGVPLHVLAEFLSGHQTLVMTLYYAKLGPQRINEVIAEASKNLLEADEDEFFDRLTELSSELLNERVVGKDDGLARLPDGDPGLWHVDVDGFCTAGKGLCAQGLERRDPETGKASYESITPNGFNCALCRFHVTGPAFLAGQVTVANTLLYAIRQRSEQQDKLFKMVTEARESGNHRAARRAQDNLDKVEMELEDRVAALGSRIGNIYSSLELMNRSEERDSSQTALITQLNESEIEARLTEASNFEGIEWASQAIEFFPQLPDFGARFRKGILLESMAQENGLKPLLLHLSDEEKLKAGNRLTTLMSNLYGEKETSDLISGKLKLEELGGLADFEALVGEAIRCGEGDAPAINDINMMIGEER